MKGAAVGGKFLTKSKFDFVAQFRNQRFTVIINSINFKIPLGAEIKIF